MAARHNQRSVKAMIAVGVLVGILAALGSAARSEGASAAARWNDGAYVRSVATCQNNLSGNLQMAFYANTRGMVYRIYTYVKYIEPYSYETWLPAGPWHDLNQYYNYTSGDAGANMGLYFYVEYGRRASNGSVVDIKGEFMPVFQWTYDSVHIDAVINDARLPSNTYCQLGSSNPTLISH